MMGPNAATDRRSLLAGMLAASLPLPALAREGSLAVVPRSDYYDAATLDRWGPWGPPARQMAPPPGLSTDPAIWPRRVIATARAHIGLAYQHHHVPDFAPPEGWPWLEVSAGRNGPGLDCSNFTSLAFNQALGIKLSTGIGAQAEASDVSGPGGLGTARLSRIAFGSHDQAVAGLRPADLLYVRNDAGRISHVVLWIGEVHGVPSFIDCTDSTRRGATGGLIPTGVRVRPFLADSWYGRNFAHALRLTDIGSGAGPSPASVDGGDI